MQFDIQYKAYYTIDGRRLLHSKISKPISIETIQQRYISEFINTCEHSINNTLFQSILKNYNAEFTRGTKRDVYLYELTVEEIIFENFSSYILFACLRKDSVVLSHGIKTIICSDEKIIPPRFFTHTRKYLNCPLIISKNGAPCIVSLKNGCVQTIPIKNDPR